MADGTHKPIEEIKIGDQLIATDPVTGESEAQPVLALIIDDGDKNLVRITVDTDGPSGDEVDIVAPRAMRAISSNDHELRGQGLTALSHMVRINAEVDRDSVARLRFLLRDPSIRDVAESYAADLWLYVPHRRLPIWLHLWSYKYLIKHKLDIWWWSITRHH